GSPDLLLVAPALEMPAQLPDRLVLLVADALGGHAHLLGDVLHRPALEAPLQDALLPRAEQLGGGVAHRRPLVGAAAVEAVAAVGHRPRQARVPAPRPLRPLLHRVDGPQELAPLRALLVAQDAVPGVRRDPFEQAAEHLLRAVGPGAGVEVGIPPARRAVAAQVAERLLADAGTGRHARGRADGRQGRAEHDGHDVAGAPPAADRKDGCFHDGIAPTAG